MTKAMIFCFIVVKIYLHYALRLWLGSTLVHAIYSIQLKGSTRYSLWSIIAHNQDHCINSQQMKICQPYLQ